MNDCWFSVAAMPPVSSVRIVYSEMHASQWLGLYKMHHIKDHSVVLCTHTLDKLWLCAIELPCLTDVPLFLEPAAFSVKTTPRIRNPKATKPRCPPMSLTLQVTSYFHFQVPVSLIHSLSVCHTLSDYVCNTDCLICFSLSLTPISICLSNAHTNA